MPGAVLAAVVLLAVALRAYPLHVLYVHPDQELQPALAMGSLVLGSWHPLSVGYPTGFFTLLRLSYEAIYVLGRIAGWWVDRVDFVGTAFETPHLLYVPPRALACLFGVLTVWLTARLGALLFGRVAGLVAALLLAVAVLAVRESHHGSLDTGAAALFTAALLAAERYRRAGSSRAILLAGVAAGATLAFRYQLAAVLLAVPLAEALRSNRAEGAGRRLVVAALAGAGAFAVLNLSTLLRPREAWETIRPTVTAAYQWFGPRQLPLGEAMQLANGTLPCALAVVGIALALRSSPRGVALVLVVTAGCLLPLLPAGRRFLRYLLPFCPLVAVFAAHAIETAASRLPGKRAATALVLAAIAAAGPAARSLAMVRLLAQEDTRLAAGRWLMAHTPPEVPVVVPAYGALGVSYANPFLPIASWGVFKTLLHPEAIRVLLAHGRPRLAGPSKVNSLRNVSGFGPSLSLKKCQQWRREGAMVVMARHPWLVESMREDPAGLACLYRHTRVVAEFVGIDDRVVPPPVFDPLDANYVPLANFAGVRASGPNLVIRSFPPPDES